MNGEPDIRPARAEDAQALAPLVRSSGARAYDWIFAGEHADGLPYITYCLEREAGMLGWGTHYVMEFGGEVIASVGFWTRAQVLRFDALVVARVLAFHRARTPGVIARSLKMAKMLETPKRGELYLADLAVDPRFRGRGLGGRLLDLGETQARARDCSVVLLDVADDNHDARRLYERRGYVLGEHRPFTGKPPEALPGHHPMRLQLSQHAR